MVDISNVLDKATDILLWRVRRNAGDLLDRAMA